MMVNRITTRFYLYNVIIQLVSTLRSRHFCCNTCTDFLIPLTKKVNRLV